VTSNDADDKNKTCKEDDEFDEIGSKDFYIDLSVAAFCTLMGGVMSGLTVGLLFN
jgi:hypothetical protein